MPKIDIAAVPARKGCPYPLPFDEPCAERVRRRLGDAGGLTDFGVNLTHLPPGGWSSQRHWHSDEDEFVCVLDGLLVLVEDGGETPLRAGDCAAFPKGSGDGHHLINRSDAPAVYLEIGSRWRADLTTCSDIDMMSANADGRFVHKDGAPYPERPPRAEPSRAEPFPRQNGDKAMPENTAQTDLDDRIAIVRRSVSDLLEESTGASGAAAEEALADRLREMQDLLDALLKKREAME